MKLKVHYALILAASVAVVLFSGCATGPDDHMVADHEMAGSDGTQPKLAIDMPPSPSRAIVDALNSWDDIDRAIELYSHAIEINPGLALSHFKRAELFRQMGDLRRAVDDYSRAIEIEPGFLQAYLERGFLRLWELGDEGGREDIERAYAIDPHDIQTALAFAGLIEWQEPEHAFEILDGLVRDYPDHPEPLLSRAKMRRDHGDFAGSAADFAAAIDRGLDESWVRVERAMVLIAAGDPREAAREVEIAYEQDPGSPDVALIRARLAILKGPADGAARYYQAYLEGEWVHQPVKLEAAYVAAAGGDENLARVLIRSFADAEEDPLRAELAGAGVLALAGESTAAGQLLTDIVRDAEWYGPAWVMLAAITAVDPEAVPAKLARDLAPMIERKVAEMRPDFPKLLFDHTELLIWLKLYGLAHPEPGELQFGL